MLPLNRRRKSSSSQSKSISNLARLDGFQNDLSITPEESTPRALGEQSHVFPSSTSADDAEASEDDDPEYQPNYSPSDNSSDTSSESPPEPAQSILNRSHSSLLIQNAFAPPFYNRPPTPLPPSPSLTSLLRPSFSATTSRPTTPDSSENDTLNDTEAAVAKSARTATTVPRASPKVPTYEYYGFVLYLMSSLCFLMYLLWSYLPSPFLHQLGINYYPNRWWSLAIPAFLVMTLVYIYVALALFNVEYLTLPLASIENIVDEAANIAVLDSKGRIKRRGKGAHEKPGPVHDVDIGVGGLEWRSLWSEGTDAVMDVPVGGVCEILLGHALGKHGHSSTLVALAYGGKPVYPDPDPDPDPISVATSTASDNLDGASVIAQGSAAFNQSMLKS